MSVFAQFSAAREALVGLLERKQKELDKLDVKRAAAFVETEMIRRKLKTNSDVFKYDRDVFRFPDGRVIELDRIEAALETSEICVAVFYPAPGGLEVSLKL